MKIQRLSLGLQNANNLRIRRGQAENRTIFDEIAAEAAHLEAHLLRFIGEAKAVSGDKNLTPAGKAETIAQLREGIVEVLAKASKAESMAATISSMKSDLTQRAEKARAKFRTSDDAVLAFMQGAEIRRYLHDLRLEAEARHRKKLESNQAALLSDADRRFHDPVEALFIEACEGYDGSQEGLISAIASAPFPVAILPQETVEQGLSALAQAVTPELHAAIEVQEVKQVMYSALLREVADVVQRPLEQAIQSESYRVTPDQNQGAQQ